MVVVVKSNYFFVKIILNITYLSTCTYHFPFVICSYAKKRNVNKKDTYNVILFNINNFEAK